MHPVQTSQLAAIGAACEEETRARVGPPLQVDQLGDHSPLVQASPARAECCSSRPGFGMELRTPGARHNTGAGWCLDCVPFPSLGGGGAGGAGLRSGPTRRRRSSPSAYRPRNRTSPSLKSPRAVGGARQRPLARPQSLEAARVQQQDEPWTVLHERAFEAGAPNHPALAPGGRPGDASLPRPQRQSLGQWRPGRSAGFSAWGLAGRPNSR